MHQNRAPPNVTVPHMNQQRPRGYPQNAHHQQMQQHPQQQPQHPQPQPGHPSGHPQGHQPPGQHPHGQQMMYHQQTPHDQAMMSGHLPMSQTPMNKMSEWNQWAQVDSGINTGNSSANQSVYSGNFSEISNGTSFSSEHFQNPEWFKYQTKQNFSRSDEEIKRIDNSISNMRETAKRVPDQIHSVLNQLEEYLADNDIRCIFLAARALHDFTRTDALIQVLLKKDQFWQKVVTALDKCNNDRVAKELARIIYDLTSKDGPQGREWCRILGVTADGLRVLIKMLEATVDHVVYCSVTSIHNIITKLAVNEKDGNPITRSPILTRFRDLHGVVIIANKMNERFYQNRQNPPAERAQDTKVQSTKKFLTICVDILRCVAFKCQLTKNQLLHERVPEVLVEMISVQDNEKLMLYSTKLLKVLSVCPNNKAKIVESGGIARLGNLIKMRIQVAPDAKPQIATNYNKIILHALWTLRNLSDEASRQPREATNHQILDVLLKLLQLPDITMRNLSAGILYNLICKNYENKAYVIQQFNGVDILLVRTDEILRTGLSKFKDQKSQIRDITDILESCVSTLRILTKDTQPIENLHESAKQAQNQIRSTHQRFAVILYLFCGQHDFADNRKITCEALRLLINLFGNRVYEQPHLKSIMDRCFHLTKYYRDTKTEGPIVEEIIAKLAHLTATVCENVQYRNYIYTELNKWDLLRQYINDVEQCPKERPRWCHSAKLIYNLQSEMKGSGSDAFWHMIHHELSQRRNIQNPQIKQNYQQHPMAHQQEYWHQQGNYPPHPDYGHGPNNMQYPNQQYHGPGPHQQGHPGHSGHPGQSSHPPQMINQQMNQSQTYMEMPNYPQDVQNPQNPQNINNMQMDASNPSLYPPGDPFQNMPNMEPTDMTHFDLSNHEMNDLNWLGNFQ